MKWLALGAFLALEFGGLWLSRDLGATLALAGAVLAPVWSVWLWASASGLRARVALPASLATALALGYLNLTAFGLAFSGTVSSEEAWMPPFTLAFLSFAYWSAGPLVWLASWGVVWARRRR